MTTKKFDLLKNLVHRMRCKTDASSYFFDKLFPVFRILRAED